MIMMIALVGLLLKFKDSPKVVKLTQYIRPTIAVLLGVMTYNFFFNSYEDVGIIHTVIIGVASFLTLEKWKTSPVFVVLGALLRSEEHTSELQSRGHLVCRLLLEKKKINIETQVTTRIK